MPRYHFHTEDGRCYPDEEGSELPNLDAPKREALVVLGEILRNSQDFWDTERFRLLVSETDRGPDLCARGRRRRPDRRVTPVAEIQSPACDG